MRDSKNAGPAGKTAPTELDEAALEMAGGAVDPASPNIVYVGGSTRSGSDSDGVYSWTKTQELRSGK